MGAHQTTSPGRRRAWPRLFGPVLFYELLCLARRTRYFALRTLYPLALLLLLFALFREPALPGPAAPTGFFPTRIAPGANVRRQAERADSFFQAFMLVQFSLAVLLTPAFTAGAVAEEKERKTLAFLLATDLGSREILFGKLASRLANLGMLLLAGLPVLSLTEFWGGVDPGLLVAGFAATGLTMLSLAAVGVVLSVHARKARDAIVLAYLVVATYEGVTLLGDLLLKSPAVATYTLIGGPWPLTCGDVLTLAGSGNIFVAVLNLRDTIAAGQPLAVAVPRLLGAYALFHGVVLVSCGLWAAARLRPVALADTVEQAKRPARPVGTRLRWAVGNRPMLWKELFTDQGLSFNRFGRVLLGLIVFVSFAPALWFLGEFGYQYLTGGMKPTGLGASLVERLNLWVRLAGTLVACLTLLGVAVRAASAVSGERDRQTLDGLLTTPLAREKILSAKWLGSLASVRWPLAWLVAIWLLGLGTGSLSPFILPWLVVAWVIYAAFLTSLGLWFSVRCRTTLSATVATLLVAVALAGAHWLPWTFLGLPRVWRASPYVPYAVWETLLSIQMYGLTPPLAFVWLSFRAEQFNPMVVTQYDPFQTFRAIVFGLVVWSIFALVLWHSARRRFTAEPAAAAFDRTQLLT